MVIGGDSHERTRLWHEVAGVVPAGSQVRTHAGIQALIVIFVIAVEFAVVLFLIDDSRLSDNDKPDQCDVHPACAIARV